MLTERVVSLFIAPAVLPEKKKYNIIITLLLDNLTAESECYYKQDRL